MKYLLPLFFLIFTSGCAVKMNDLKPATKSAHFTLEQDLYVEGIYGLLNYHWVHGLKAGTYVLIGEDKEGFYYHNSGDVVIALSEEYADSYLKKGVMPAYGQRNFPNAGPGGLWIPKDKQDTPQIYYLPNTGPSIDSTIAGGNIGLTTTGSGPGFLVGAVTMSVIAEMVRGSIQKIKLEEFSEIFTDVKIVETLM
jgi:hypothetical protein